MVDIPENIHSLKNTLKAAKSISGDENTKKEVENILLKRVSLKKGYEDIRRDIEEFLGEGEYASWSYDEKIVLAKKCGVYQKTFVGLNTSSLPLIHKLGFQQIEHLFSPLSQIYQFLEEKDTLPSPLQDIVQADIEARIADEHFSQIVENIYYFWETLSFVFDDEQKQEHLSYREILHKFIGIISLADIEIEVEGETERKIPQDLFSLLFQNLISNYRKYGENGKITLILSEDFYGLKIENKKKDVKDTGEVFSSKTGTKIIEDILGISGKVEIKNEEDFYSMDIQELPYSS